MKKMLIAALVAAAALAAVPARAANVTVTLEIRAGRIEAPPAVACGVTVPAGSDGVVVLAAAKAKGCIVSYETGTYPGLGRKIVAIDELREAPDQTFNIVYWAMSRNDAYTPYGVDLYSAAQGDRLGFTYTTWLTCLTPADC